MLFCVFFAVILQELVMTIKHFPTEAQAVAEAEAGAEVIRMLNLNGRNVKF